jgi:type IX secretion system PorP/SprF family membrane protein
MIKPSQSLVRIVFIAFLLTCQGQYGVSAQNLQFRQAFAHRTLLNPALIGTGQLNDEQSARISSGTKGQWLGLGKRLFAQSIAMDAPISNTNAAYSAGVYTTDLISGSEGRSRYSHISAHLGYAYEVKIRKDLYLKGGINTQFSSFNFGAEQFFWEDQINASNTGFLIPTQEPNSQITKNVFHASAGLLLYGSKGYFGVAALNVNQPDISFFEEGGQNIPLNINIHAGYEIFESESGTKIIPSAAYSILPEAQSRSLMINGVRDNFRMGLGLQNTEAYSAQSYSVNYYFGARYDKYYIGYANDWNMSVKNSSIPLTHEISIIIFPYSTEVAKRPNPFPEY